MAAGKCVGNIGQLSADCARLIEWYFFHGHDDSNMKPGMQRFWQAPLATELLWRRPWRKARRTAAQ